ncbi:hypothetical protein B0H63DRAFT_488681 [Podospora didyma]|uniref:NAD(P)-binding domain-containing protein n=1 Tax=Podospora didyma TaxID=330526 RepID=A0AAE0N398_9PEZI|nr:hypothetical protein B0H63DRAFT_488681 [Podospora didyma]
MSTQKTIVFLGASTGIGLAALRHTLTAGHQCIAICRTPSKLTDILPIPANPNLQVVQGNAHDGAVLAKCIRKADGTLVDQIVSTIGPKPNMLTMQMDDPFVCRKFMSTLLETLTKLRNEGATGRPRIVVASTTGMSKFGRDTPLVIVPFYNVVLKVPHQDKGGMEDALAASGEEFTIVRATWLLNGEKNKPIRVGIEDPKTGRESEAIGYSISREDAGRWVAENLVIVNDTTYRNKIATITY